MSVAVAAGVNVPTFPKPAEVRPGQRWWLHDRAFTITDVKHGIAESADGWQIGVGQMLGVAGVEPSSWLYLGETEPDPDLDAGLADGLRWLVSSGPDGVTRRPSTLRAVANCVERGEHRRPR